MIPVGLVRKHILAALARIDLKGIPPGRQGRSFELCHAGRKYPPKLVISVACEEAFGRQLPSSAFSGGDETNRHLQGLGFTVTRKTRPSPTVVRDRRRPRAVPGAASAKVEDLKQELLCHAQLHTWSEIAGSRDLPPATPGVYAWFFTTVPPGVPPDNCVMREGRYLLYVGISPRASSSRGNLRSRIRNHFRGNAEGSTFRLTLGCLLESGLGSVLRRVGTGKGMTFGQREAMLNVWLDEHAAVAWVEVARPWLLEDHIVKTVALPLNIDKNDAHPFCSKLKALRAQARRRARELPVLVMP